MKRFQIHFLVLFLSILTATSCQSDKSKLQGIKGKGPITEKSYELNKGFDKISTAAAWNVELIKSDHSRIVIKTQENIHPLVDYKIKDGELSISYKRHTTIQNVKSASAIVYYKNLTQLKAASASRIFSKDTFDQKTLQIDASSASRINLRLKTGKTSASAESAANIKLSGTSIDFKGRASSRGSINAENLKTKTSDVSASSTGAIKIFVLDSLKAESSSVGSILYKGDPKMTSFSTSSGGRIKQKN